MEGEREFLGAVPPALAERVSAAGRARRYGGGQLIHGPGAPSGCLFRIEAGAVRFRTVSASGEAVEHARLGPGHWFGDIALMADAPPPHDALAEPGTVLRVVPRSRFLALLREDPSLAVALARLSSRRLLQAYAALDALRSLPTEALVARFLLAHRDEGGMVRLTQAALAGQVGRSRSAVSPVLNALARAGVIRLGRGVVSVADEAKLRQWADPA